MFLNAAHESSNVYRAARWNAPDPVLLAATPYEGVMHTSDLYFLFDGKFALFSIRGMRN